MEIRSNILFLWIRQRKKNIKNLKNAKATISEMNYEQMLNKVFFLKFRSINIQFIFITRHQAIPLKDA